MDKIYKKILNGTVTFKQYWKGQPVMNYGIVTPTPPGPDYTEPFYIQDLSGGENTITIAPRNSVAPVITPYYSFDKVNWVSMGATSLWNPIKVIIPANGKVYFRCKTEAWADVDGDPSYSSIYGNEISASGDIKVGGNIMSLLYGEDFTGDEVTFPSYGTYTPGSYPMPYQFGYLFGGSIYLIDASELLLPATNLVQNCYWRMFRGCKSLINAPTLLPASVLVKNCYRQMFTECTSLTTTPIISATIMGEGCCQRMFYGCSKINRIECRATDISASDCLTDWVNGVAATGTFIKNPNMSSWPTGVSGIPSGWTVQDA